MPNEPEFEAASVADIDQYLASLDEMVAHPLQSLRRAIAEANGDTTIAYLRTAQEIVNNLEHGGEDFRVGIGMSYVGLLFALHRKETAK